MKVALLDDYQHVAMKMADWNRLKGRAEIVPFHEHIPDQDELVRRLQPFDAVMLVRERTKLPRSVIERLSNLKLIITAAHWNVAIDLDAATDHNVQVCGTLDWGFATAELALGLMIALARNITIENRAMREGRWQTTLGSGLHGKTLGIVGLGLLGSQMARFGQALGMEVLAWSQNLTHETAAKAGAKLVSKRDLLAQSDYVTIHLKLSDRTRGVIGRDDLATMKPTAYIINTSRGPIIDEAALLDALKTKRIAGAGLDVYSQEPLPLDNPFRTLDNVILLPHLGYVVEQNYRLVYSHVLEDIEAFLDGRVLRPLNELPTPKPA
jgi:phosphoglycerate dehydrogenase-like enzyme